MRQPFTERLVQRRATSSFHWASWGDEYVVFDEVSGQTHLLDPVKAYILEVLSDGPAGVSNLSHALAQMLAPSADANQLDVIVGALEQLERAQLIETASL